jgi:multimeric flavodoxin WrbA
MTKIRTGQAPAPLTREPFRERFNVRFDDPAWVAAHAVIVLAPTYRYQSPSPLKRMIDRMVCADGGNPDPTTTHGKHVAAARLDRYIGYHEPYYSSHETLDKDTAVQEEARKVALSVVQAVKELRAGQLSQPDKQIKWPRQK